MLELDLSKFRQNAPKDTTEDMQEIANMKQTQPIPEGMHEVVVVGIYDKNNNKFKLTDKCGGSLSFNLIVRNAQNQEQMIYVIIPLAATYIQACRDKEKGSAFLFSKTVRMLQSWKIDPISLREAILATNGTAADALIGTQFILINSWNPKMIHLEYDRTAKAHFFVTSQGEKFESGEMCVPLSIDTKLPIKERYKEFIAIAHENGYSLATQMETNFSSHPTANNDHINLALSKFINQNNKKTVDLKKIPDFPIKKIAAPIDVEDDISF